MCIRDSRYPVSSTVNSYSYSSSDNAWKPIRDKVKKIVIGKGITSIPESAFEYDNNLTEVQIEPGWKSIGKKAFYSCDALRKITIPSSVSSIGEDILWTGYYWVSDNSHVVRAKIYAPSNSCLLYTSYHNIAIMVYFTWLYHHIYEKFYIIKFSSSAPGNRLNPCISRVFLFIEI